MQNVISIWMALDLRRRLVLAGSTIAVFVAVLLLASNSSNSSMQLLYAGLDGKSAGQIITALDQRSSRYEVRGDSIWVEAGSRDALRMTLAAEGLPTAGGAGYELLDTLSGFGTTAQMFDAAYWRAKEGELARTILSMPDIRAARVHIAKAPADPFRSGAAPGASVTVTTAGGRLSEDQARALKHLVAAAVAGMTASDVQVIDSAGGLIDGPEENALAPARIADRAAQIRLQIERLLAARVGTGNAVVEVSLELITEQEQFIEKRFDPQGRVAVSSDSEERSSRNTEPGGAVTVASNLPEGDAGGTGAGQSEDSEFRERLNFELSGTQREITRVPGGIRRMTIAVLVDGERLPGPDGLPVWQPRSDAELAALQELVAAAAGADEARGDVITLKSMEFSEVLRPGAEGSEALIPGLMPNFAAFDLMALIRIGALSLVALILGLFVLRPLLAQNRGLPAPAAPLALAGPEAGAGALTGEISPDFSLPDLPVIDFAGATAEIEDPASRLRRLIQERQAESIEILRGWLDPEEEPG